MPTSDSPTIPRSPWTLSAGWRKLAGVPVDGWLTRGEVVPNPLGVVPVVPLVNRSRLLDVDGESEIGGLGVYSRLGFGVVRKRTSYVRRLPPTR